MAAFNPLDDALKFAIYKEEEAYYFYTALANRVSTQEMRKVLEKLAQEELEHKEKLELEVMKLGKTIDVQVRPADPDRKYILSDTEAPLDMDYKDILLLGIAKEEASFRRYIDLAAQANNEKSREIFLALAQEEVKHKLRFEQEYDLITGKKQN